MNDTTQQIVIDTLGARIGALMVENVTLLARIHELEQRSERTGLDQQLQQQTEE